MVGRDADDGVVVRGRPWFGCGRAVVRVRQRSPCRSPRTQRSSPADPTEEDHGHLWTAEYPAGVQVTGRPRSAKPACVPSTDCPVAAAVGSDCGCPQIADLTNDRPSEAVCSGGVWRLEAVGSRRAGRSARRANAQPEPDRPLCEPGDGRAQPFHASVRWTTEPTPTAACSSTGRCSVATAEEAGATTQDPLARHHPAGRDRPVGCAPRGPDLRRMNRLGRSLAARP